MNSKQKFELIWDGKEKRQYLEPRVLVEDSTKSYHAKIRHGDDDIFDNMLIHGDNLLALKALEQDFAGKVKCIYIDPPFNTGASFENYDDGVEHSIWLSLMRERLFLLNALLDKSGSIFIHLDDNEVDYCKVIMDEIFGRKNFINRIVIEARAPSAFSTVNPGVFKATEYILWYAKDKDFFEDIGGRVPREPDYAYSKWLVNPENDYTEWTFRNLIDVFSEQVTIRGNNPRRFLDRFNRFIVNNAERICRFASISDTGAGQAILELKKQSIYNPDRMYFMDRGDALDKVYILNGQQLIFYSKNVCKIDGELMATKMMTNIWTDIAWEGIAGEGGVKFKKGKKPERLIRRILELSSKPGDLVLDSFLGSGTTCAVAHKMKRRWIGIELGEQCYSHCIPRLQRVVSGEDKTGISQAVNWHGGGGFRFYELGESLIKLDQWGQPIIDKSFNAEMLAQAVCKLEGFEYAPSQDEYFIHGHSTEHDFIYVTTNFMRQDHLDSISQSVGTDRTLLICCKGFEEGCKFGNLTMKKIPKAVLDKCEWGKDDYSLNVAKLPKSTSVPVQAELF